MPFTDHPSIPGLVPVGDMIEEFISSHPDPAFRLAWALHKNRLMLDAQIAALCPACRTAQTAGRTHCRTHWHRPSHLCSAFGCVNRSVRDDLCAAHTRRQAKENR